MCSLTEAHEDGVDAHAKDGEEGAGDDERSNADHLGNRKNIGCYESKASNEFVMICVEIIV